MGEIMPQAVCTGASAHRIGPSLAADAFDQVPAFFVIPGDRRLSIAAAFVPLTQFLMYLFFIVAFPVAKAIDYFLGEDRMQLFRR